MAEAGWNPLDDARLRAGLVQAATARMDDLRATEDDLLRAPLVARAVAAAPGIAAVAVDRVGVVICERGAGVLLLGEAEGMPWPTVSSLAWDDAAESLWLGTAGGGVARWRRGAPHVVPLEREQRRGRYVAAILPSDGGAWCGTGEGLVRVEADGSTSWVDAHRVPGDLYVRGLARGGTDLLVTGLAGSYRICPARGGCSTAPGLAATMPSPVWLSPRSGDGAQALEPVEPPVGAPFHSLLRPCPLQPALDQTYLFGTTLGGRFRPHRGVEFNAPPGAPVLAPADGVVDSVGPAADGNRITIDHPVTCCGWRMRTVYTHCRRVFVHPGQAVRRRMPLGEVGDLGRATNAHLHFEVLWLRDGGPAAAAEPSNPELWLRPLRPGCGTVALRGARSATGFAKTGPLETPFLHAVAPDRSLRGQAPGAGWLVVGDLDPGTYRIEIERDSGEVVEREVQVRPGAVSLFDA